MATPTEALGKLRSDPRNFLRQYFLMTVRAMGQSGPTAYWLGGTGYVDLEGRPVYNRTARPGRVLGTLRMQESKNFKFSPNRNDLIGTPAQLMVWHVDVTPSASIVNDQVPALAVSRNGGPDIMVTTLLNGCTFACEATPHAVLMAHVQPTGGTTAPQLETYIMNRGALVGGAGARRAFGGGRCYTAMSSDVTIVGVRAGQQWRIFAQIHPRNEKETSEVVEFFTG